MEVLYDKENVFLLGYLDYEGIPRVEVKRRIGEVLTSYLTVDEVRFPEDPLDGTEGSQYYNSLIKVTTAIIRQKAAPPEKSAEYSDQLISVYQEEAEKHPLLMLYMEHMFFIVDQFIVQRKPPVKEWLRGILIKKDAIEKANFDVYRYRLTEIPDESKTQMCCDYCERLAHIICGQMDLITRKILRDIQLIMDAKKKYPKADEDKIRMLMNYESAINGAGIDYIIEPHCMLSCYSELSERRKDEESAKFGVYRLYDIRHPLEIVKLELIHIIRHNLPVYICKYCHGTYMNYEKGSKTYCGRVHYDGTACRKVGARRTYTREHHSDPIHRCYNATYNRMYKHFNEGRLEWERFNRWLSFAQELREFARAGELSVEEFEKMMKDAEAKYKPTKKVREETKV